MPKPEFFASYAVHNETGAIDSAYFGFQEGEPVDFEAPDKVIRVERDEDGHVLGMELLGPCKLQTLYDIVKDEPHKDIICKFIGNVIPVCFVVD